MRGDLVPARVHSVDRFQGKTLLVISGVGVYRENKEPYHIKSNFLVYSVGLSPSSETGVYSSGHDHHLQLFNTKDGSRTDSLVGHYATPTKSCLFMQMRLSLRGTKT